MKQGKTTFRRAAANGTGNQFINQVIGNKADSAAVGTPSSTESLMAYLKQLVGTQPEYVAGTTDTSPLASMDLWSISGPVILLDIWGIVTTTAIQAQATTVQLSFDPDDGGSDVALDAGSYDATGAATGHVIRWTKDLSEALVSNLDVMEATDIQAPGVVIGQAGDIKVTYGAASTGQINWHLLYLPVGGGRIVAG